MGFGEVAMAALYFVLRFGLAFSDRLGVVFGLSFPELTESGKDSAYLGRAKRKTPSPQRGQECQQKQCNSKASDNRFSMTSTTLSTDSVYE